MINGAHIIINSRHPEADRAFIRDVLEFPKIDAGGGWLIFKAPPTEIAVHPIDGPETHDLYLMCDDLTATVNDLAAKGVVVTKEVSEVRWGRITAIRLPGGGEIGLYEPRHPTAFDLREP